MNIGQAAKRTHQTARMLRYRESLGLLAPHRTAAGYRVYSERDVLAASLAADLEARHGVEPAALAFALRALHDPALASELRTLARLAQRPEPLSVLDFEQAKARRLLRLAS